MVDFLKEYWDEIVAFIDEIYFAIKALILGDEAAE